jgi:ribosomal protein L18E
MNISKTRIKVHLRRKTSPSLVQTIAEAKKNSAWLPVAKILSNSTRKQSKVNLAEIEKSTTTGDTVLILGKVLSLGDMTKKVRICSLGISESALEKLKKTKCEYVSILDEIKINPKFQGVKIIK